MHLRTLAIADSAGDVVQLAMMRACTEVQLATGNLGSEDGAGIQAVAVVAAADTADVVGEHTGVQLEIALRQGCRDADAALEGECVGEGGALHEGDEPRARQFFKRLEVVVLTKADGRDFALPLEIGVGQLNFRSEEHTSELQSLIRISYAFFCLKK